MNQHQGNQIDRASMSSRTSASLHQAAYEAARGVQGEQSFNGTGNTQEMINRPASSTMGRNQASAVATSEHTVAQLMYAGDDEVQRINHAMKKAESQPSDARASHQREPSAEIRLRQKVEGVISTGVGSDATGSMRLSHREQMAQIEEREKKLEAKYQMLQGSSNLDSSQPSVRTQVVRDFKRMATQLKQDPLVETQSSQSLATAALNLPTNVQLRKKGKGHNQSFQSDQIGDKFKRRAKEVEEIKEPPTSYVQTTCAAQSQMYEEGTVNTQSNYVGGKFAQLADSAREAVTSYGAATSDHQGQWGPRDCSNASQTEANTEQHQQFDQFVVHSGGGPQHVPMSASMSDLPMGTEHHPSAARTTVQSSIQTDVPGRPNQRYFNRSQADDRDGVQPNNSVKEFNMHEPRRSSQGRRGLPVAGSSTHDIVPQETEPNLDTEVQEDVERQAPPEPMKPATVADMFTLQQEEDGNAQFQDNARLRSRVVDSPRGVRRNSLERRTSEFAPDIQRAEESQAASFDNGLRSNFSKIYCEQVRSSRQNSTEAGIDRRLGTNEQSQNINSGYRSRGSSSYPFRPRATSHSRESQRQYNFYQPQPAAHVVSGAFTEEQPITYQTQTSQVTHENLPASPLNVRSGHGFSSAALLAINKPTDASNRYTWRNSNRIPTEVFPVEPRPTAGKSLRNLSPYEHSSNKKRKQLVDQGEELLKRTKALVYANQDHVTRYQAISKERQSKLEQTLNGSKEMSFARRERPRTSEAVRNEPKRSFVSMLYQKGVGAHNVRKTIELDDRGRLSGRIQSRQHAVTRSVNAFQPRNYQNSLHQSLDNDSLKRSQKLDSRSAVVNYAMSLPNERDDIGHAGSTVTSGKLGIGFLKYKTEKAKYGSSRNSVHQQNTSVRSSARGKSAEPRPPESIHGKPFYSRVLNSIEERNHSTIGQGLTEQSEPLSQTKIERYRRELRRHSQEQLRQEFQDSQHQPVEVYKREQSGGDGDQSRLTHASLAEAADRLVSQFPEESHTSQRHSTRNDTRASHTQLMPEEYAHEKNERLARVRELEVKNRELSVSLGRLRAQQQRTADGQAPAPHAIDSHRNSNFTLGGRHDSVGIYASAADELPRPDTSNANSEAPTPIVPYQSKEVLYANTASLEESPARRMQQVRIPRLKPDSSRDAPYVQTIEGNAHTHSSNVSFMSKFARQSSHQQSQMIERNPSMGRPDSLPTRGPSTKVPTRGASMEAKEMRYRESLQNETYGRYQPVSGTATSSFQILQRNTTQSRERSHSGDTNAMPHRFAADGADQTPVATSENFAEGTQSMAPSNVSPSLLNMRMKSSFGQQMLMQTLGQVSGDEQMQHEQMEAMLRMMRPHTQPNAGRNEDVGDTHASFVQEELSSDAYFQTHQEPPPRNELVIPRSEQFVPSSECAPDSSFPAQSYHRNVNSFSRSAVSAVTSQAKPAQVQMTGEDAFSEQMPRQIHNATYHSEAPPSCKVTEEFPTSVRSKGAKASHMLIEQDEDAGTELDSSGKKHQREKQLYMRGLTHVLEQAENAVEGFRNAFVDKYGHVTESAVESRRHSSKNASMAHPSAEFVDSQRNARSELNPAQARTDGMTSSTMKMLKNCQLAVHDIQTVQNSISRRSKRSKRAKQKSSATEKRSVDSNTRKKVGLKKNIEEMPKGRAESTLKNTAVKPESEMQLSAMFDMITPNEDDLEMRRLVAMQLEQAKMLQDLQKQLISVQQIEHAASAHDTEPLTVNHARVAINPFIEDQVSNLRTKTVLFSHDADQIKIASSQGKSVSGSTVDNREPVAIKQEGNLSALQQQLAQPPPDGSQQAKDEALTNSMSMSSRRGSGTPKLSATQMSQLSSKKTSTINLIQRIFSQMEKLDKHITKKEQIEESRFAKLEKSMRKLARTYNRVLDKQRPDSSVAEDIDNADFSVEPSVVFPSEPQTRNQKQSYTLDDKAASQERRSDIAIQDLSIRMEKSRLAGSSTDLKSRGNGPVQESFGAQFPSVKSASHANLSATAASVPADRAITEEVKGSMNASLQLPQEPPSKEQLVSFGSQKESRPESTLEPSEQKASEPALVSNNSNLEGQVGLLNEAILALRSEHSLQLIEMKNFYTEQISLIREEVAAAASSAQTHQSVMTTQTPVNTGNRKITFTGQPELESRNMSKSVSVSSEKAKKGEAVVDDEPGRMATKQLSLSTVNEEPLIRSESTDIRKQQLMTETDPVSPAEPATAQCSEPNSGKPPIADKKLNETLDQLNKAVGQKERLEAKLKRIKEKIKEAKSIRLEQPRSEKLGHSASISECNTSDIYMAMRGPLKGQIVDELNSRTVTAMGSVERTERSVVSPKNQEVCLDDFNMKTIDNSNLVHSERPVTVTNVEPDRAYYESYATQQPEVTAGHSRNLLVESTAGNGWSQQDSTLVRSGPQAAVLSGEEAVQIQIQAEPDRYLQPYVPAQAYGAHMGAQTFSHMHDGPQKLTGPAFTTQQQSQAEFVQLNPQRVEDSTDRSMPAQLESVQQVLFPRSLKSTTEHTQLMPQTICSSSGNILAKNQESRRGVYQRIYQMQAQQPTPVYVKPAHISCVNQMAPQMQAMQNPSHAQSHMTFQDPSGRYVHSSVPSYCLTTDPPRVPEMQEPRRNSDVSGKSYTVEDVSSSMLESSAHDEKLFSSATQSDYNQASITYNK